MRICIAGASGAFGMKHMDAVAAIDGAEVTSVVGTDENAIRAFAQERGVAHYCTDLADALARDDVDAVILATPTQLHAAQAIQCLEAGKHVMVEIPMADNIEDARRLVETQKRTGLVAMAGHTRRFNPSHQWIHNKIQAGELKVQQMDVQTYFSAAPTRMPWARRGPGPTICCGTMPATPSTCSSTRPAKPPPRCRRWKARLTRSWVSPWT